MTVKSLKTEIVESVDAALDDLTYDEAERLLSNRAHLLTTLREIVVHYARNGEVEQICFSSVLRLISEGKTLVLDASDGKATIAQADKVFTGYIDSDFKDLNLDQAGVATQEILTTVYEIVQNTTFAQMFHSVSRDLDKFCLTQSQIISFVTKHKNWLRKDGYATFFLFKVGDEFCVALVSFNHNGRLMVCFRRLDFGGVWLADSRRLIVLPQL